MMLVTMAGCMQQDTKAIKTEAPYGAWTSPLTATRVTAGALRLGEIALDGDDVYWTEGRASEGGRYVIVKRTLDGRNIDVTPAGFNARSRAHEYGGAAMTVHRGDVYFSNFTDQRLYLQPKGGAPVALTAEGLFFAETRMDAARDRLVAVREDHRKGDAEPPAAIVAIDVPRADRAKGRAPEPSAGTVLVSGADFYSDPIVSPDGATLAWLQWNHPNMPWDGTELWTAAIKADGSLGAKTKIAGSVDESIFQPEWSPDGVLYFVSDRTGWWNLYRLAAGGIQPLHPMSAEFGKPQWTFSMVTYAFAGPKRIAATYVQDGRWKLAFIETDPVRWEPVLSSLDVMESLRADERALYFVGASPTSAPVVARMTLAAMEPEVLRASTSEAIDAAWIAPPEPVTFSAGAPPRDVHAFYYAPKNPHFAAPAGTMPPLLVLTHGGPTAATEAVFDAEVQFWTSRGFAVLDVNYSGSTGYGRAYRQRLDGAWGIADVADCAAGARHLAKAGLADGGRIAIAGGSAGGYTTLMALATTQVFAAGSSHYGVSDLGLLLEHTHKFESGYLHRLMGTTPGKWKDVFAARSPINLIEAIRSPVILFQGLDDKVVPPEQSRRIVDRLKKRDIDVAYHEFAGEAHGFRKAETIVAVLEAELAFLQRVLRLRRAQ